MEKTQYRSLTPQTMRKKSNCAQFNAFVKFFLIFLLLFGFGQENIAQEDNKRVSSLFAKENLLAWCIVPYDAEKRNSEERALMLKELNIGMLAYDWREEHIPTFDEEWKALNKYGIKLQGFWMNTNQNPSKNPHVKEIFDFLERNNVKTQLWLNINGGEGFNDLSQEEKVVSMAETVSFIAKRAATLGCQVALYNHRGWYGEPENQLAIIEKLNLPNIGMVYNFHHAQTQHQRFSEFFPKIVPYLFAVNLAGLKRSDNENFYPIGKGDVEEEMIRVVIQSKYIGPIGILNHDTNRDAKLGLETEMKGLKKVLESIGGG